MKLGRIAVTLAMAIIIANSTSAISEFNYLFPEFSPPSTLIFIFAPRNCLDAAPPFTPMERNFILDGNEGVSSNFDMAISSQEKIKKISRYIPKAAYGLPVFGGAFSYVCFDLAVKSTNHANAAIKAAFLKIDADFEKLDLMQGTSEIFSRGIADELKEIEEKMLSKDKKPILSKKIDDASKIIAKLQLEYPNTNQWGVLNELIGIGGILQETQVLNTRLVSSIETLEQIHLEESEKYPELLFNAQFQLGKIKESEIPSIKRLELNELEFWEKSSERFALPEYGKYLEIENEIGLAKLLQTDSSKVLAKKQRGYLAVSYLKLKDANKKFEWIFEISKIILDETEKLERFLQQTQENLKAKIENSVEKKSLEPFAHAYLKTKLDEYKKRRAGFPYEAKIGKRVNEFIFEIGILEKLAREADASDILLLKRSEILSDIDEFSAILKRAKTDGVDTYEEESKLISIKGSLESFGLDAGLPVLEEIENNLLKIKKSLGISLENRYLHLNGQYFELVRNREFLQLTDRIALDGYERYFDGGEIDLVKALGNMAGMEKFLSRKIEETREKKKIFAKDMLQNSIVIWETVEESGLDRPVNVTATINIENPLGFDLEEARLKLDLPLSSEMIKSSGNMRLEKEKDELFINIKQPKERNFAVLEYQIIANSLLDDSVSSSANLDEAKISRTIRFQTFKRSEVDLEFDAISEKYSIEYKGAATGRIENGKLLVRLAAAIGENEIKATFIAKDPFAKKINLAKQGNSQVLAEAKYQNKIADLPAAHIFLHLQTECEIAKVIVDRSDFEVADKSQGNFLELDLKTDYWAKDLEKAIHARLFCNNEIASIVNAQIDKADPSSSVSESLKIENARLLFAQGRYLDALKLVQEDGNDFGNPKDFENTAEIIEKTAKLLIENPSTEELGNIILGKAQELKKIIAQGAFGEAKILAEEIEDKIGRAFDGKIALAKQECKNQCMPDALELLDSAIVWQISGDYFKAFYDLFGLEKKLDAQKIEMENSIKAKLASLEGISTLNADSSEAFYQFELFFEIPIELKAIRQKDGNYKEGVLAKAGLKKLLLELEGIDNAVKTGLDLKYSKDFIDSKMKRGNELLLDLQNSNSEIEQNSQAEIDEMEKRLAQFGGDGDLEKARLSRSEFEKRHYFSAFSMAKNLNYGLVPKATQKSADLMPYALPISAILVGIAYFALFRKKE